MLVYYHFVQLLREKYLTYFHMCTAYSDSCPSVMSKLHHHSLVFVHLVVVVLSAVAGELHNLPYWAAYHHLAWEYRNHPDEDLVEDWTSMQMGYYFD